MNIFHSLCLFFQWQREPCVDCLLFPLNSISALGETKAVIVEDVSESNPRRQLTSNSEGK